MIRLPPPFAVIVTAKVPEVLACEPNIMSADEPDVAMRLPPLSVQLVAGAQVVGVPRRRCRDVMPEPAKPMRLLTCRECRSDAVRDVAVGVLVDEVDVVARGVGQARRADRFAPVDVTSCDPAKNACEPPPPTGCPVASRPRIMKCTAGCVELSVTTANSRPLPSSVVAPIVAVVVPVAVPTGELRTGAVVSCVYGVRSGVNGVGGETLDIGWLLPCAVNAAVIIALAQGRSGRDSIML
jgi:hypothetical protein